MLKISAFYLEKKNVPKKIMWNVTNTDFKKQISDFLNINTCFLWLYGTLDKATVFLAY